MFSQYNVMISLINHIYLNFFDVEPRLTAVTVSCIAKPCGHGVNSSGSSKTGMASTGPVFALQLT